MALTYRNRRTGKVVDIPEPQETGRDRRSISAARSTIEQMDNSSRWERLSEHDVAAAREAWAAKLESRRPKRTRSEPTPVYVVNHTPAGSTENPAAPSKPPQVASKAEWVAYAQAQGIDDAESMTKAELLSQFGDIGDGGSEGA